MANLIASAVSLPQNSGPDNPLANCLSGASIVKAELAHRSEAAELYARGLFLQAYERLRAAGPWPDWSDPEAVILAQRIANQLGAPRRAHAWTWLAYRRFPGHPRVAYYFARTLLYRRGPWLASRWCEQHPLPRDASREVEADWYAFRGTTAALLRDFEAAEQFLARALDIAPRQPWVLCERACVWELEDQPQQALAGFQRVLADNPSYVPAVGGVADALERLGRADEALALLTEAADRFESGDLVRTLAGLLLDRQQHAAARARIQQHARLCPLAEKTLRERMAGLESDAAYHEGDVAAALELARQAGKGFHARLAENLEAAPADAPRVMLDVPYVRQDHVTCAPATLTALGRYWRQPVEHVEVAEQICYDGTPAHSERAWATEQGLVAREFTVDWETAVRLVDRGVPFTLTTVEVSTAHLQAVIGYDARRSTLLIRDPSSPRVGELMASTGLEHYRPSGPRGMTFVPQGEAHRLDGLELPDAPLYDALHALDRALVRHDRETAASQYQQLCALAPEHRLTHVARRTLASYDADPVHEQQAHEQLCRLYSDAWVHEYGRWCYLRSSASRAERLDYLAAQCAKPETPLLLQLDYAEELSEDARELSEVHRRLRRLETFLWNEPRLHRCLGHVAWSERRFDDAVGHYRRATCLADKDERFAALYFRAARQIKATDAALEWLDARRRRYATRSSEPAQSLFNAYAALDRMPEAFRVLDEALERRPEDGGLLLFAADAASRSNDLERARALLERARGVSHASSWLQTRAEIAERQGELHDALESWGQVLELQPQSPDAVSATVRLLRQLRGPDDARAFLVARLERFPHNVGLLQHVIDWFREDSPEEYARRLARLLEANPVDGWARRELALALSRQRKSDEALAEAEVAVVLEPSMTWAHSTRGSVLEQAGRLSDAETAYRRALELSIDNEAALYGMLRLAATDDERRRALDFAHEQIVAQTNYGEGLMVYAQCARGTLAPDVLLVQLRAAQAARPDLWPAWSALIGELLERNELAEAERLAAEAVERFRLVPAAWIDLAQVRARKGDAAGEIEALEQALAINPVWSRAAQQLADAYRRQGNLERERDFLVQAVRRVPLDAVLRGYLADAHWRLDERTTALGEVERAVELDLDYGWAWGQLLDWGQAVGEPDRAVRCARRLAQQRAHNPRAWYWLGRVLLGESQQAERREALARAIELHPRFVDAHVWLARAWVAAGDPAQALAVLQTDAWGPFPPAALRLEEARVLAAGGDLDAAVARAQAVVDDHTDDVAAWSTLAQLALDRNHEADLDLVQHAAERMVQLAPQHAEGWAWLGDALRRKGDIAAARDAYRQTLRLDPAQEYCTNWLFDYALEEGNLDEAEELLNRGLLHGPSPYLLAREIQWAAKFRRADRALAAWERILRAPAVDNPWCLENPLATLSTAGWRAPALKALLARWGDDAPSADVYRYAVRLMCDDHRWSMGLDALRKHARPLPAWHAGAQEFLRKAAEHHQLGWARKLVDQLGPLLRQDADSWGTVGFAFSDARPKFAVEWMADWSSRSDVRPWMLHNLANAFEVLERFAPAVGVRRRIRELPAEQESQWSLIALVADEIILGHWAEVEALEPELAPLREDAKELGNYFACLLNTVRAALDTRRWWSTRRRWYHTWQAAFRMRRLATGFRARRAEARTLRRAYELCGRSLGREHSPSAVQVFSVVLQWF